MTLIQRFANKLILVIIRKMITGIGISSDMTDKEIKQLAQECYSLKTTLFYTRYIDEKIHEARVFCSQQAENYDTVMLARGTINGLLLVKQGIEAYSSQYEDSVKPLQKSDSIIERFNEVLGV